jgi:hypothetical protein
MAKRRRRRTTTTTTRRAPRRNPSRARRARRAVARRAGGALGGLNFKQALKSVPLNTLGMLAAKWAAKRFGEAASETDPATWNYASYLKGAAGAAAAGFLANMIKRGTGQRVLEGGMALMLYKLFQNEVVPGREWLTNQFGADTGREPGVIESNSAGEPFILGEDYQWYPLNGADDYRMEPGYEAAPLLGESIPGYDTYMGDALTAPGPLGFGDALTAPGPLGFGSDMDDMYRNTFLRR